MPTASPDRASLEQLHRQRIRNRRRGLIEGLLACVFVGSLWLTSCWWNFGPWYGRSQGISQGIILDSGLISINARGLEFHYANGWAWVADFHQPQMVWLLGWICAPYGTGGFVVVIPLWHVLCLYLGATLVTYFRHRGLRVPGHCPQCNYNLTGNTSGSCPECGAEVADLRV